MFKVDRMEMMERGSGISFAAGGHLFTDPRTILHKTSRDASVGIIFIPCA